MKIPESLINKIKSGKCILFLGSGASISSGGPNGKELCEYIRDNVVMDERDYDEDLAIYIETLKDRVSRKDLEIAVMKRLESLHPSKGYTKMIAIPWKAIYTTNYDTLTEDAYKLHQPLYRIVKVTKNNQYDILSVNEIPLYKIHGCICNVYDPSKPLVLSYSDLHNNIEKRSEYITRLTNNLIDCILFVGYSFNDGVVIEILKELKNSSQWETLNEKYAVILNPSKTDEIKFKSFGINTIDSDFDSFFCELVDIYNTDQLSKLKLLKRDLQVKFGQKILNPDPMVKDLIDTYFDYYIPGEDYENDELYFYRGGKPSWGNIISKLDVPRTVKLSNVKENKVHYIGSGDLVDVIEENVLNSSSKYKRIMICGPAAVGKTTLMYRLTFELMNKGILSLICKNDNIFRQGLLVKLFQVNNNSPFVIFVDVAASASLKISQMYNEAIENGLPIIFVLLTRENDWSIYLDGHVKKRLDCFDYIISLEDKLNNYQSELLVENLLRSKVLLETPEKTRNDLEKIFKKSNHLMVSLMENIENTKFDDAIISEYDRMSSLGRKAYGLISLVSRLGFAFKWELLQRTLNHLYGINWNNFITEVIQHEGKGVIKEDGQEPNYYYTCRHSLIAEKISIIHYKNVREDELEHIKAIIKSVNKGTSEEYFIGRFIHLMMKDMQRNADPHESILDVVNTGILSIFDPSFLLHIKGQYLLETNNPEEALECFQKNVRQESWNKMYSLHSVGMTHFAIAKMHQNGRRQLEISKAKECFQQGVNEYEKNPFFYQSLLEVLLLKANDGNLSKSDFLLAQSIVKKAQEKIIEDEREDTEALLKVFSKLEEIYRGE